jgi:hypothetical protein
MAGNQNDSKPDVSKVRTWPQVVAIIVGYSVVQITLSLKPDTAPYSMVALVIFAFCNFSTRL